MALRVAGVHLSGGQGHEHITELEWHMDGDAELKRASRQAIVDWLESGAGNQAFTEPRFGGGQQIFVHSPYGAVKYLRTRANGVWSDNLLALPRY